MLLASAGWWVLSAPSVEHAAVTPPPEIDIDPPGMRARREAALALATMPDDPWTFAESLAASAPDKAAEPDKENCGMADAPQLAATETIGQDPTLTRGAGPRYLAAQARIDAALRASADPLDRATADLVNAGDLRTEAGADEAVVQQAAASADPRVVALGHAICRKAPQPAACAGLTAERWAQVDAGNGMPWIDLLAQARARGDAAGVQDAMTQLAAASRFDMRVFAAPGAVVRHLPEDNRDLAAAADLAMRATGRATALAMPAFQPLLEACRDHAGGDEQRTRQCVAIGDTMYAHSDTLLPFVISGAVLLRTTGDGSRRALIKTERDVFAAHWSPATGLSPCGELRALVHKLARDAEIGEVETMREEARKFVTP